jgi:hypothetical protein
MLTDEHLKRTTPCSGLASPGRPPEMLTDEHLKRTTPCCGLASPGRPPEMLIDEHVKRTTRAVEEVRRRLRETATVRA